MKIFFITLLIIIQCFAAARPLQEITVLYDEEAELITFQGKTFGYLGLEELTHSNSGQVFSEPVRKISKTDLWLSIAMIGGSF